MTDIKVTQADLNLEAWLLHRTVDGIVWEGMVADLFARHRIEAQRPLLEALDTATRLLWEHCEGIAPRIEEIEDIIKQAKGE